MPDIPFGFSLPGAQPPDPDGGHGDIADAETAMLAWGQRPTFMIRPGDEGLDRLPAKANKMFGYLRYLRIPDGVRPVMRNYSVRAYRPATESMSESIAR